MRQLIRTTWLALTIMASCKLPNVAVATTDQLREIKLGTYELRIPERHFRGAGSLPSWLMDLGGLDKSSNEIMVIIEAHEVASLLPKYKSKDGAYNDDLCLRISALSDKDYLRSVKPDHLIDAWMGRRSYENRVVELVEESGAFRVYRNNQSRYSWELFEVVPQGPVPDDLLSQWAGHCLHSDTHLTPTGGLTLCKGRLLHEKLMVEFTVSSQNISMVKDVKNLIRDLIAKWRVK